MATKKDAFFVSNYTTVFKNPEIVGRPAAEIVEAFDAYLDALVAAGTLDPSDPQNPSVGYPVPYATAQAAAAAAAVEIFPVSLDAAVIPAFQKQVAAIVDAMSDLGMVGPQLLAGHLAAMAIDSGDPQTSDPGVLVFDPCVVVVTDDNNDPIEGVVVHFAGTGLTPANATDTTDAAGLASSGAVTAAASGVKTLLATIPNTALSATFHLTATPAP
jgi:hypothetical protein